MQKGQEHSMYNFHQNLKGLKGKIKKWNKEEFGNITKSNIWKFASKRSIQFGLMKDILWP